MFVIILTSSGLVANILNFDINILMVAPPTMTQSRRSAMFNAISPPPSQHRSQLVAILQTSKQVSCNHVKVLFSSNMRIFLELSSGMKY